MTGLEIVAGAIVGAIVLLGILADRWDARVARARLNLAALTKTPAHYLLDEDDR